MLNSNYNEYIDTDINNKYMLYTATMKTKDFNVITHVDNITIKFYVILIIIYIMIYYKNFTSG